MEAVTIDLVSDVVCPWCYLGKKRLEQALAQVSGEVRAAVTFRPYQLNPDMPLEGKNHKAWLTEKFGSREAVDQAHQRLAALGHEAGIAFDFDAVEKSPNTLDAHRLIRWAMIEGPDVQAKVASSLFKAYFEDGRDVGDRTVLLDIAEASGMDRAVVCALFSAGADIDSVKEEIGMAREMGITGVPCFILDNQYAVVGAQSVETLAGALREIAALKRKQKAAAV
ncbi:DsbA family oxidoreductase [Rhizobium sp. TRM95111]|uniref:DsbA family oxidoreductase n=1 Tax=Rhizobium alarense TaxID=2846851 RepID=UPI001F3BDD80|nr:DsbA family oxidoreductase [Rhizobium alarense]MCF3638652.1 DsbA family oxidoreductase [Rhizobium alarense]